MSVATKNGYRTEYRIDELLGELAKRASVALGDLTRAEAERGNHPEMVWLVVYMAVMANVRSNLSPQEFGRWLANAELLLQRASVAPGQPVKGGLQ